MTTEFTETLAKARQLALDSFARGVAANHLDLALTAAERLAALDLVAFRLTSTSDVATGGIPSLTAEILSPDESETP